MVKKKKKESLQERDITALDPPKTERPTEQQNY